MRDKFGKVFSRAVEEQQVATQRLGGGMISDDQIISVSASKITGGDAPGAGTLENALVINTQDGSVISFDGAAPEEISLTKVDAALSASSVNAVSNKAVTGALGSKADTTGSYATLTAGKVVNKITFTGAATGVFDGSAPLSINIPAAPVVPTKLSELTNDSGFITAVPAEYVTDTELTAKGYQTAANVTSSINTALTPYIKTSDADGKYVKLDDLNTAVAEAMASALADYYTKTEADARFEPKTTA